MVRSRDGWWLTIAGLATVAALTACQKLERKPESLSVSKTGDAALHAVQSQRLKALMSELNGMGFERLPQELAQGGRQQAHLEKVSAVALGMAEAAAKIPGSLEAGTLQPEEAQIFRTLAERLRSQALQLSDQARKDGHRGADATMHEISATCAACHTLFRNTPQL